MLSVLYISAVWLSRCCGDNHCINLPYTRLLDNQIQHLRWHFPSRIVPFNITMGHLIDDSMCQHISVSENTPYNYRAMCPWTYIADTDENRYPMRLNVVKCRCSTCADNFECKPVFYTIPVLKRVCRNGVNRWIQAMQYISVACYCIRVLTRTVRRRWLR